MPVIHSAAAAASRRRRDRARHGPSRPTRAPRSDPGAARMAVASQRRSTCRRSQVGFQMRWPSHPNVKAQRAHEQQIAECPSTKVLIEGRLGTDASEWDRLTTMLNGLSHNALYTGVQLLAKDTSSSNQMLDEPRIRTWMPVHAAARLSKPDAVTAILQLGGTDAQIKLRDGDGRTVLHAAAEANSNAVMRVLFRHIGSAEEDARDTSGMDALDIARFAGNKTVVAMLEQRQRQRHAAELLLAWSGIYCDRLGADCPFRITFDGEIIAAEVRAQLLTRGSMAEQHVAYAARMLKLRADIEYMRQCSPHAPTGNPPEEGLPPEPSDCGPNAVGVAASATSLTNAIDAPSERKATKGADVEVKIARMKCLSYSRSCEMVENPSMIADPEAYTRALGLVSCKEYVAAVADFETALGLVCVAEDS